MRACTRTYDKYIMFTYVYIYIYIFESSVPESEKEKKKRGGREKGKEKWKNGRPKVFWKVLYLVGSFSTLHRPVHSRLLTRRSLPLTRGYRFSKRGVIPPVGSSALRGSLHASYEKNQKSVSILCYVYTMCSISLFTAMWILKWMNLSIVRENFVFFFISFEIVNKLVLFIDKFINF